MTSEVPVKPRSSETGPASVDRRWPGSAPTNRPGAPDLTILAAEEIS